VRILLVVHGLPPANSGGTETYTAALARALAARPDLEVGILSREADPSLPELHVRTERRGDVDVWFVNNTFQACTSFEETYRNPRLSAAVLPCIEAFGPDVVHVQHLTCLSTELMTALARRHPVVMTLHDYWPICHRGQLLNVRGERCDGPGNAGCAGCIPPGVAAPSFAWRLGRSLRASRMPLGRLPDLAARLLSRPSRATASLSLARAAHMREVLAAASALLAPSSTLFDQYCAFGTDRSRLISWELGIERVGMDGARHGPTGTPLRLLFLGGMMLSKAPGLVLDAVDRLPAGAVSVEFLGSVAAYHGDSSYASALSARLGHPAVRRSGPAPRSRIVSAFARADVIVMPSIWIENAPLVIKEAFACGVPVVASRLGGMAELVHDGVNGLLFTPGDAGSLADALGRLLHEPDLLPALRRGITAPLSIEEDAANLEALYRRHAAPADHGLPMLQSIKRQAPARRCNVTAVVLNYRTPDETFLAIRSVEASRHPAGAIVVDNGGRDAAVLRQLLPAFEVLATGANLGFSGGCNVGIRRALDTDADAVLLLNSDAILHPDALDQLVDALQTHPSAGIAAPVLCASNDPAVVTSAGISYDESTGRMRHRGFGRSRAALGRAGVTSVDAASGCALLIRRDVFERCGLLDEAYFFSFEDVEFCLRARAAGFATFSVPAATVYHTGGASIGATSARRVYYGVRNHLRLAQQVAPASAVPRIARSAAIVGYTAAYVALSPDVPLLAGAAALSRGCIDYLRSRYGA
jgi:GT2 family glycosyltransferase/glycosyltransferase involved in cell wall biosynthesis